MRITSGGARRAATLVLVVGALAAGCGDDGGGGRSVTVTTGASGGPAEVTVSARDIAFDITEINAPAGDLEVTFVEDGSLEHTFVVDGVEFDTGEKLRVSSGEGEDSGTLSLEAGTYEYFCDIPGHRGQGMEGTIVVE